MSRAKEKRREARKKHEIGKRRAQYRRALEDYREPGVWEIETGNMNVLVSTTFDHMIEKVLALGTKTLQQLLSDIDAGIKVFWDKKTREDLKHHVQLAIMERTMFK